MAGKGAVPNEWTEGWKLVLACALGSGTGVILLFFTFSLFVLPVMAEFGGSRGEMATIQSLVVAGALGSPLIGRAMDLFGFKAVFVTCMAVVIAVEAGMALFATSLFQFGVAVFLLGLFGVGTTALTITRPINAAFDRHRGRALGMAAAGLAVATMVVPPALEAIVAAGGWRMAVLALAGLAAFVGLPAILFLVPAHAPVRDAAPVVAAMPGAPSDYAFMKAPVFWLMATSLMAMGLAGAGFVGQMSPMIQEEGLSTAVAALALSFYAGGQLAGRLVGGWFLDHFNTRQVAFLFTLVPASGFVMLLLLDGMVPVALLAAFLIGLQQGAEIDIFAYFTARAFGIARYGTVYGALLGLAWIGNAAGVIGVGLLHDAYGNYAIAQAVGAASLALGAVLIALVKLPEKEATKGVPGA